jgi:hypothetical protein
MHSRPVVGANTELDALGDDLMFEDEEVPNYLQDNMVSAPTNDLPNESDGTCLKLIIAVENNPVKMGALGIGRAM